MRSSPFRLSGPAALAAAGGGAASALLSLVATQKTSLAVVLGGLAPLPIMLATLSFGPATGGLSAVLGAVVLAAFGVAKAGAALQADNTFALAIDVLTYGITIAMPAWWLSLLAGTTRLTAPTQPAADARKLGLILSCLVVFASVSAALDFLSLVVSRGGFDATMTMLVDLAEPYVRARSTSWPLPHDLDLHKVAEVTAWAQMPILAASALLGLGFNLWLAARITRGSGHLQAPWPDLPRSLAAPRPLALLLAAALGLVFAGGLAGMLALVLTGALLAVFAIQGLAVVHDATRGKSTRLPLLIIVYITLPWMMLAYVVVGLADAGFAFRERSRSAAAKKP